MSTYSPRLAPLPPAATAHALLLVLVGLSSIPPLFAQSSPPSIEIEAAYSYSARSDAEFAGQTTGDIAVSALTFRAQRRFATTPHLTLGAGLIFDEFAIDASSGIPVPETLRRAALDLSATWQFRPDVSATIAAQPGFFGDGESFGSSAFNVPAALFVSWQRSAELMIYAGVRIDAFSDNSILPALGVRWKATPAMTVSVGLPRTEITYDLAPTRTLFAGLRLQGGAFHTDDPVVTAPAGYASLRDTEVSYREIRAGAGVRWRLDAAWSIELEGGWVIDRRFDYDDRDFVVKTDGAAYGRLGLSARF